MLLVIFQRHIHLFVVREIDYRPLGICELTGCDNAGWQNQPALTLATTGHDNSPGICRLLGSEAQSRSAVCELLGAPGREPQLGATDTQN